MTTIVFDMNETLLSLHPLDNLFEQMFGSAHLRKIWFSQVLHVSMVTTITGRSQSLTFADVAGIALDKLAMQENITLTDDNRARVGEAMRALPPHPDTEPGIKKLHAAGIRLAVLTNTPQASLDHLMEVTGLGQYMAMQLSVQAVGKFKPSIEVYQMATEELGESPGNLWMVAAHDWDIEGALNAGWHGAFIQRAGKFYHPDAPQPDVIVPTISDFANRFVENDLNPH